jgi:outer membrane protein assembly factor BamB
LASRRRLPLFLLLALPALALLSIACGDIAQPKGWASPVVVDGTLLVAHRDDLYAYDAETLEPQWRFPPPSGNIDHGDIVALYGTPAVLDGTVFLPTYDGTLFAIDIATGAPVWIAPFETDGPLVGGVLAQDGTVYFGSSDGYLYAVDAGSGTEKWSFKTDKEIWSTPVIVGDALYVTSLDGKLYVLDVAGGEERWSFETDAGVAASPVIDDANGRIYLGGFDARLRAIDIDTRDELWVVKAKNWFWSRPVLDGDTVFAPSMDHHVYAVDSATGNDVWDFNAGAEVLATSVSIGAKLFVADRDGNVYAIDKSTGETAFDAPLDLAGSVLSDLLVMDYQGAPTLLVLTTGGRASLVDPDTLQIVREFQLGGGSIALPTSTAPATDNGG